MLTNKIYRHLFNLLPVLLCQLHSTMDKKGKKHKKKKSKEPEKYKRKGEDFNTHLGGHRSVMQHKVYIFILLQLNVGIKETCTVSLL